MKNGKLLTITNCYFVIPLVWLNTWECTSILRAMVCCTSIKEPRLVGCIRWRSNYSLCMIVVEVIWRSDVTGGIGSSGTLKIYVKTMTAIEDDNMSKFLIELTLRSICIDVVSIARTMDTILISSKMNIYVIKMIISSNDVILSVVVISPLCGSYIRKDEISFCYGVLNTQTLFMSKKYAMNWTKGNIIFMTCEGSNDGDITCSKSSKKLQDLIPFSYRFSNSRRIIRKIFYRGNRFHYWERAFACCLECRSQFHYSCFWQGREDLL